MSVNKGHPVSSNLSAFFNNVVIHFADDRSFGKLEGLNEGVLTFLIKKLICSKNKDT